MSRGRSLASSSITTFGGDIFRGGPSTIVRHEVERRFRDADLV